MDKKIQTSLMIERWSYFLSRKCESQQVVNKTEIVVC